MIRSTLSYRRRHYLPKAVVALLITALVAGAIGCGPYIVNELVYNSLAIASTDGGQVRAPGEGSFAYWEGAAVELGAEPEAGYRFIRWTATTGVFDDEYAGETTFTMPAEDVTVTAVFEKEEVKSDIRVLVWTDDDSYGIGESIEFSFENQSGERVVYGTAEPVWTVERYTDGIWAKVDVFGSRAWPCVMIYMEPGETATHVWDQTEYITDPDEIWEMLHDDELVTVWISLTPFSNEDGLTGQEFVEALKEHAQETQAGVIAFIEETGGSVVNTFWLANSVLAEVRAGVLDGLDDVEHVQSWRFDDHVVQARPGTYRLMWHGETAEFVIVDNDE
ncbi:MAG: hypothetical protein IBX67_02000 [Dehalococcoidia bacterium]|nr:hypothetical protein [Dehalococcoidia bacterium]